MTDLLSSRGSRGEATLRGGSFGLWGAGLELHEEWKRRREVGLSNADQILGGFLMKFKRVQD